jgi:hypothetical protein
MTEPFSPASDMRGDFSRIRFDPSKHYTTVLQQQGRVAVDADANEQRLIDAYQSETELIDVVGEYGGPVGSWGFHITVPSPFNDILIGPGRYYVEGLLCDNQPNQGQANVSYDKQPYLNISSPTEGASALLSQLKSSNGAQQLQVNLQVWQRLQTALDNQDLLEPAIGNADTTARLQTVWRVLAKLVATHTQVLPLHEIPGTMLASTAAAAADCGCGPVAAAGYQGVENQLYRVEIHNDGSNETPTTFKWSRENGSVAVKVTAINGSTVTVSSLGPDANLGFQPGQWVELTDDANEFGPTPNTPGTLYQIASVQPADPSVTLTVPPGSQITIDQNLNARMRRWDQSGPSATNNGIPLSVGQWVQLENGIQVQFSAGAYHSGDYWTIPARTATGQIEWPGGSIPATSIEVYSAPLATVSYQPGQPGASPTFQVTDMRKHFSPLTALTPPATPPAIHVKAISWVNDDVITLDQLAANGLTITLDQTPTSPITAANFAVTVQTAWPGVPAGTNPPAGLLAPATVLRLPTIVDTPITTSGTTLTWKIPFVIPFVIGERSPFQLETIESLDLMLYQGAPAKRWALARVRLMGDMIYAAGTAGQVYLDGRALGQPGSRADKTPRIDLALPSGSGVLASDFEGWFFLAPTLQITTLVLNPPASTQTNSLDLTVQVGPLGQVTGVEVTGSTTTVSPTATVNLTYPAATGNATISLVLTGAAGVGTIATIQATAPIPIGATSVSVPINIVGNPGVTNNVGNKDSFTVTASIAIATGGFSAASANFSVTGVAPPPPRIILHLPPPPAPPTPGA